MTVAGSARMHSQTGKLHDEMPANPYPTFNDAIQVVVGEKLSSVTFVLDDWQLDFDGHRITILTNLSVSRDGIATHSGQDHFRDWLCEQIGKLVEHVEFADDVLVITFGDASSIRVFARPADYEGPEALTFHSYKLKSPYVI